jgi:striatin 1/3/4
VRQEKERDKSKSYLVKCTSEVSYHVLPTSHVPPDVSDPLPSNSLSQYGQPTQQELQDAYIQMKRQNQERYGRDVAMVRETSVPVHHQQDAAQQEPNQLSRTNTSINHAQLAIRGQERKQQDRSPQPMTAADLRKPPQYEQLPPEEQIESVSHTYDSYGRQLPQNNEHQLSTGITETKVDLTDGWDFDDGPPQADIPREQPLRPDMEVFPSANQLPSKSPPRLPPGSRRKSSGARRRSESGNELRDLTATSKTDNTQFKVRFAMRGHLDVVRSVIFTGGGSPSEPEFCTGSDDGGVKRWHIPASYAHNNVAIGEDLDRTAHFTHRGHVGAVTSLAACPASPNFSNGGRAVGDGWIFSGGEDSTVRVWERGRVDSKAVLEGHRDAVWALCVLPGTAGTIFGERCSSFGGPDRVLLAAGGADGTILIWAVSQPPQLSSPHAGSNRGTRGSRRANSISAGSNFPSSPQPSVASSTIFNYTLVHRIERPNSPAPTSISPLSPSGESFVVSYADASVLIFDTRTGEEVVGMASQETYDGSPDTGVNVVVATATGFDTTNSVSPGRRGSIGEDDVVHGATGGEGGVEGVVIAGYEDKYIRFFDANSGMAPFPDSIVPPHTNETQDNARTQCSPIRPQSLPSPCLPTAESWSQAATMRAYASGIWRNAAVRRRSKVTASCVARASAASSGVRMAAGLSAAAAMARSRSFLGHSVIRRLILTWLSFRASVMMRTASPPRTWL